MVFTDIKNFWLTPISPSTEIRNKKVFCWKIVRNILILLKNYYENWDEFYQA